MIRSTIAWLSVLLCVLVTGASLIVFSRTPAHAAASSISVLMFNGNLANSTNSITPNVEIVNTGTAAISLESLTVRYYYTEDGSLAQNFWCDYSTIGSSNVTGSFASLSSPVTGADHYLQIGFTSGAGNLAPGATVQVATRFAKTDWSNFNQANDYSFNASSSQYVPWTNATGYISGVLSWGAEAGGAAITPTPTPTQVPSDGDNYFPAGTSVATMMSTASALTPQQVKQLIEQEVNDHWSFIQSKLGFTTEEKAYAFFLGQATRESTFQGGLETGGTSLGTGTAGSGSSGHSYGPLQAAETAYANTNPNYQPEPDVPQLYQYSLTPGNFYDIGISLHMGIRHLIHFANQAQTIGYTGVNILRYGLVGYNTGWVTNVDPNILTSYADEIGALSGWYLNNGHLYDNAWVWTGDSAVDRSNPWGWY